MDVAADLAAPHDPDLVFSWVDDLARYPSWLEIVPRAEPADAAPGDPGPAWLVDLRGRVGPFTRSKRLRMVRTEHRAPEVALFERRELDGRSHAPWRLRAEVQPEEGGCRLLMQLHYGGALWGPVLERLLGDEIGRSRQRLLDRLASG